MIFYLFDHTYPITESTVGSLQRYVLYKYIDEGVEGSGMGLFLIGGHWPKILPQNSKGAS
jgi:hypothetical protein